ncbi:MAG: DNA repair protein RecO [Thermoguttaceae bacterium]
MEKTDAIVLRRTEFSESSLILTLYTHKMGKIEVLAKGGRRLKGPFESALDTLAQISVIFLRKKGDVLDLLTESKLQKRFHASKSNVAGLFGAFYVAEIVNVLTENGDSNPKIFALLTKTLNRLEQGTFVMRTILRFEGLFLAAIGEQPSLRRCVECGITIHPDDETTFPRKLVPFGYLNGGVMCPHCADELRQTGTSRELMTVSADSLRGLAALTAADDGTEIWTRVQIADKTFTEIRRIVSNYMSHVIGWKPRLHEWMKFIHQNDRE